MHGGETAGTGSCKRFVDDGDEDGIDLLDVAKVLELIKFDPGVEPKDPWEPPNSMISFSISASLNSLVRRGETGCNEGLSQACQGCNWTKM